MSLTREQRWTGLLLGTAVGDAVGLPREGLSPSRARRMFGPPPLRHRLLFGRGMVSDDTEHASLTGQALLASGGDPERFERSLALRLVGWLFTLPAGIGWATLRSTLKLALGLGFLHRSGSVSAGNGPAMRAPVLGAWASADPAALEALVLRSTRLTHRHALAEQGALLVARAAAIAFTRPLAALTADVLDELRAGIEGTEWQGPLAQASSMARLGASVTDCCRALGLEKGVTGYILHTVPVVLFAWIRHAGDFRRTVEEVICAGGDSDTTGAIAGALAGATAGESEIPTEWLDGLWEWPRSVSWMRALAARLSEPGAGPLSVFWPGLLLRSAVQIPVVLAHGFRRLAPPYSG